HPLQIRELGMQLALDGRQRDVHDGSIEQHHEEANTCHGQRSELSGPVLCEHRAPPSHRCIPYSAPLCHVRHSNGCGTTMSRVTYWRAGMNFTTRHYAVLASLAQEPRSGYDIAQWFGYVTEHFCAFGHSSIYPTLADLEQRGLVAYTEMPSEQGPTRKVY